MSRRRERGGSHGGNEYKRERASDRHGVSPVQDRSQDPQSYWSHNWIVPTVMAITYFRFPFKIVDWLRCTRKIKPCND
jgi:hypothetical protein